MTSASEKMNYIIAHAKANVNLAAVCFQFMKSASPGERPQLMEEFFVGYKSTPTDGELLIPQTISDDEEHKYMLHYGSVVDAYMMELQDQHPSEKDFYTDLWNYISESPILPNDKARVVALFNCAIDKRLPYFKLDYEQVLSMENEEYKAVADQIGESTFSKMEYILNAEFEQKTEQASLIVQMMDGISVTPTAIYIILPDESPIFDSISGVLCSQIMEHYVRLAQDKYNGKLPCRLNVCLEELGNIGKSISSLAHWMSASRSRNIRCQLVLQSLSQLDTLYGPSEASTIRSNADVLVAFRTNHWETLTELSHKCGEREVDDYNHVSHESLITPSQLASMETGQALVMISGHTKFITWIPDFTEMFDCSKWKAPKHIVRKATSQVSVFDIKRYVQELKKKKMRELMGEDEEISLEHHRLTIPETRRGSMSGSEVENSDKSEEPSFDIDALVAKIDAKIAQLEAEEAEGKAKETGKLNEKNSVVLLAVIEGHKLAVVKAISKYTKMPLKEAKDATDNTPHTFTFCDEENAEKALDAISAAGGIAVQGISETGEE